MANRKLPARDRRTIILRIPVNARERKVIEERVEKLSADPVIGPQSLASFVRWMALCAEMPKSR